MNSLSRLTGHGSVDVYSTNRNKIGYQQKNNYSCGYFCAKAIINTLGNKDVKNLVKKLRLTTDGVRQTHLINTLRSRGVSASVYYNLNRYCMEEILSAGKYIIVYHYNKDHWMVLGDIKNNTVAFYDPEALWHFDTTYNIDSYLNGFGIVCGSK
jgi:predicted double-glycine peptidase